MRQRNSTENKAAISRGVSLVELLVVMGIFSVIVLAFTTLQRDVQIFNTFITGSLSAQEDARRSIKTFLTDARSMSPSSGGAYAIAQASSTSLTFYGNIDADSPKERVRYFLDGTSLKRGIIEPQGSLYTYSTTSEVVTVLAQNVVNGTTTPLFQFFNQGYTGTESPLAQPISVPAIRLVKIEIVIDKNPVRTPTALSFTTQVSLRNLKDQ